ncbi:MAG TPA: PilZ domain-containing protein [Candidatus Omnitrophota bacterium]|nr:PilZ domain-containing protein [Candidatus Omnitrophota bacterium]HPD84637.1 PilZ domain-containing protein [Candidatus Omnitrophota bacterium]HRZ03495.1 PilZ domain-containing protein [Candidatus Omnitrophota bacterium]
MQDSDKRKSTRFDCRVPVVCKKGNAFDSSLTLDISRGGVGFLSTKFIPVNTKMPIELALTPDSEPILAVGKVRWVRQLPSSDFYRVGMTFADVASGSCSAIEKAF